MTDAHKHSGPPHSGPSSSSSPPVGTIVLLLVAALLHALMLGNLADSPGTDAAGRGLAEAFAALVGLLLWILLASLLFVAMVKGWMPPLAVIAGVVLLPLSAVASVKAMSLYDRQHGWWLWVPGLLPPLIALYALWVRLPALHLGLPAAGAIIGVAMLAISAAPFVGAAVASRSDPEHAARLAAEQQARQEEEQKQMQEVREREAARFARLGPGSSMSDYLPYLYGDRSREARQGIRQVKSRQADAILLLQQGRLHNLTALLEFDVDASPDLCRAYGDAVGGAARQVSKSVRTDYLSAAIEMELQLPNIQWLVGERCDLGESLDLLETNVRAVADSSRLTKFADTLAKLRQAR